MYRVKLGTRAVVQADRLALSYARARAGIEQGLRRRPPRAGLPASRLEIREAYITRAAHHLALLALCQEYSIGLWARPLQRPTSDAGDGAGGNRAAWAQAVAPQGRPDEAADEAEGT